MCSGHWVIVEQVTWAQAKGRALTALNGTALHSVTMMTTTIMKTYNSAEQSTYTVTADTHRVSDGGPGHRPRALSGLFRVTQLTSGEGPQLGSGGL